MDILPRICSKCGEARSDFGIQKGSQGRKDRINSWCNRCKAALSSEWNKSNPEKTKLYITKWRDENPDKVKAYRSKNKERHDFYSERWRNENRERANEVSREWYHRNKDSALQKKRNRRAREKKSVGKITKREWDDLCNKYGRKCLCCGTCDTKMTLDHVIPLSKGGTNTIENAQPLCKSCNSKKATKIIDYRPKE